jgi:hypothetical protein
VVVRAWWIAVIEEFAGDWVGAMTTGRDVRCLRHSEDGELGSKLERQLRLQLLDSPCEVSYVEKSSGVDGAAVENIATIYVRQTCGCHVQPRPGNDAVLDRDILVMVILNVARGLDFDETPATVSTPMQNVHFHQHVLVLQHRLEDRRNFRIGD